MHHHCHHTFPEQTNIIIIIIIIINNSLEMPSIKQKMHIKSSCITSGTVNYSVKELLCSQFTSIKYVAPQYVLKEPPLPNMSGQARITGQKGQPSTPPDLTSTIWQSPSHPPQIQIFKPVVGISAPSSTPPLNPLLERTFIMNFQCN
ncbi:hypothetical protein E2C01_046865 [Portunus trituberculatus]|uniref:Uncharacterized protein n=1 Tax=Portunus trituberculatus TaxID=210409 RepID=A0A5B7G6V3_PORTR|nr:hypothetical protein [Portunus trituberculatus]